MSEGGWGPDDPARVAMVADVDELTYEQARRKLLRSELVYLVRSQPLDQARLRHVLTLLIEEVL